METDFVSQSEGSVEVDDPLSLHRDTHPVGDSFHVSASFQVTVSTSETALAPRPFPSKEVGTEKQVNYKVVNGAPKRGKPILTDTYLYIISVQQEAR